MFQWLVNGEALPEMGFARTEGGSATSSSRDPAHGGATNSYMSGSGGETSSFASSHKVVFTESASFTQHISSSSTVDSFDHFLDTSITEQGFSSGESSSESSATAGSTDSALADAHGTTYWYTSFLTQTSSSSFSSTGVFSGTTKVGTNPPNTTTASNSASFSESSATTYSHTESGIVSASSTHYGGTTGMTTGEVTLTTSGEVTLTGSFIRSTTVAGTTFSGTESGAVARPSTTASSRTYTWLSSSQPTTAEDGELTTTAFTTTGAAEVPLSLTSTGEMLDPLLRHNSVWAAEPCLELFIGSTLAEGAVACACDFLSRVDRTTITASYSTETIATGSSLAASFTGSNWQSGRTHSMSQVAYEAMEAAFWDNDAPQLAFDGSWEVISPVQNPGYQPASACLGSDPLYVSYSILLNDTTTSPHATHDRTRGLTYDRNGVTQVLPLETYDTLVMLSVTDASTKGGGGLGGNVVPNGDHTLSLSAGCYSLTWHSGSDSSTEGLAISETVSSEFPQGVVVFVEAFPAYAGGGAWGGLPYKITFTEKPCYQGS